jgi:hypothetical protein
MLLSAAPLLLELENFRFALRVPRLTAVCGGSAKKNDEENPE